jgi:hypothetical protein
VRALPAHRDARFYLAGQALSTVGDNALWLAMGIWVKIPRARKSPESGAMPPVSDGQSRVPVGNIG